MRHLWRRIRYLLDREAREKDLADEMRLHRELLRETGARSFGNTTAWQERSRAVWIGPFLESLAQDARYAFRSLRANPGFAATAILSLALGIGANTAIFSLLNAVMLRSLPVEDPRRLVQIGAPDPENSRGFSVYFTNPIWEQIRDHQQAFSGALAFNDDRFDLAAGGESHFAQGLWVSGDFFRVLGVPAIRGRVFSLADDVHGGGRNGPVAVISYRFWQEHFGGDPEILGKSVNLNRHAFRIVGVTPKWFSGLDLDTHYDVAIPIGCEPLLHTDASALKARSWWWLRMVARLKPGESLAQAAAMMKALAPEVNRATLPDWGREGQKRYLQRTFGLRPAATGFSATGAQYKVALITLMVVVGLVLLIACANIANLLLARASARQREISIRMAIGAGRRRLMRQLISESLLLSLMGAAAGLMLATWGSRLLVHLLSTARGELQLDTAPDWRVMVFTTGVAVVTGLLFGLAPAWRATGISPNHVLKEHARGLTASHFSLGRALVMGQVALSLMLLIGAGLFIDTLRNLLRTDLGFSRQNILLARVATMKSNIPKEQRSRLYQEIVNRLRTVPGVAAAASSTLTPISGETWNTNMEPEGFTPKGKDDALVYLNRVSPGYFATLHQPLLLGRDFSEHDDAAAPKVIVIDDTAARRFFGAANPIGKVIRGDTAPGKKETFQVIGVVKGIKYERVNEEPVATAYFPTAQDSDPFPEVTFEVRSSGPVEGLVPAVRSAIADVNRNVSVEFSSFETQVNESIRESRMVALLSGFFGGAALLLAMIGLYGVTAYGVARRQGEIGIRMALGAQQGSVVWLILREVTAVLAIGAAVGTAGALLAGRLVNSLLYGVKYSDWTPIAVCAAILAIATGVAAYVPAYRASRMDPMSALREE